MLPRRESPGRDVRPAPQMVPRQALLDPDRVRSFATAGARADPSELGGAFRKDQTPAALKSSIDSALVFGARVPAIRKVMIGVPGGHQASHCSCCARRPLNLRYRTAVRNSRTGASGPPGFVPFSPPAAGAVKPQAKRRGQFVFRPGPQ